MRIKMRKKIVSLFLVIVMCLGLFTGCTLFKYDNERDYKHDIVPQKRRDVVHPRYGIKLFFVRIHSTPIIAPRRAIRKRPRAKINKKSGSRDKIPRASAFFSCYFLFGFFQS